MIMLICVTWITIPERFGLGVFLMKTIFSYMKPYKWYAILAIVFVFIELSVDLLQPIIIAKIIDDGIVAGSLETIWSWAIVLVVLSFVSLIAGILNSYFSSHTAQSFSFDLRNALFRKIQTFTMATYLKFPTSSLITRLTSDVTQVQTVLFMSLRIMLKSPLIVIGSLTMAFLVNAKMALFLIAGVPILIFILLMLVKSGIKNFGAVQRRVDRVNRVLQESLQAIRLVKAYMRGDYEYNRLDKVANALKFDTIKALRLMEVVMPTMLVVMNIGLLAAIWIGAEQIRSGEAQVGELVAIINYSMRMTGFFAMFAFFINLYSRAKASSERMEEILLVKDGVELIQNEEMELNDTRKITDGTIRFEHVSFVYPNTTKKVLDNISFEVAKGEKLAIMGATGSGKSTLLNLIPRFYEPTSGAVYVNNENVANWDLKKLRSILGIVPQKAMLFTGSIIENVRWGKNDASLEEVQQATEKAQIHHAIKKFPAQYDTRVGQKGVNLSGGQKQRLSIARALIKNTPILILDDSTSALDVKTESALWDSLEEEGATMLVVTQKVSTAKGAHNILLLDEGKVVAFGNHEELIRSNKLYQQIAKSQGQVGEQL